VARASSHQHCHLACLANEPVMINMLPIIDLLLALSGSDARDEW
jgi:hypothetical protein